LIIAIQQNQPMMITCLNGLGADLNRRDYQNFTPLVHAICQGDEAIVEQLVGLGADKDLTVSGIKPINVTENLAIIRILSYSVDPLANPQSLIDFWRKNQKGPESDNPTPNR
jgi:ankyrin repeat protein